MSPLTDPLGPDLKATLRALKLGKLTATLPERLTLARQSGMPHADFLQLILSDEVARRKAASIALRAKNAGLDPACAPKPGTLPPPSATTSSSGTNWSPSVPRRPPRRPDPGSRRRRQDTPGHRPGPHRRPPPPHRRHGPRRQALQTPHRSPPRQHPGLRYRRLTTVDLLIIDDFALQPLTPPRPPTSTRSSANATAKPPRRHIQPRRKRMAPLMTDPLLAQSAIDRLTSTCHELIVKATPPAAASAPHRPRFTNPPPVTMLT